MDLVDDVVLRARASGGAPVLVVSGGTRSTWARAGPSSIARSVAPVEVRRGRQRAGLRAGRAEISRAYGIDEELVRVEAVALRVDVGHEARARALGPRRVVRPVRAPRAVAVVDGARDARRRRAAACVHVGAPTACPARPRASSGRRAPRRRPSRRRRGRARRRSPGSARTRKCTASAPQVAPSGNGPASAAAVGRGFHPGVALAALARVALPRRDAAVDRPATARVGVAGRPLDGVGPARCHGTEGRQGEQRAPDGTHGRHSYPSDASGGRLFAVAQWDWTMRLEEERAAERERRESDAHREGDRVADVVAAAEVRAPARRTSRRGRSCSSRPGSSSSCGR